jgi:hypothetical protein
MLPREYTTSYRIDERHSPAFSSSAVITIDNIELMIRIRAELEITTNMNDSASLITYAARFAKGYRASLV